MKKAIIAVAAVACAAAVTLCGCATSVSNNYYTMTDSQFQQYLEYLGENGFNAAETNMETSISKSSMSAVSLLTFFPYKISQSKYGSSSSGAGDFFDRNFGNNSSSSDYYEDAVYSGSGIILDIDKNAGDAYILTNCHVVYDDTSNYYESSIGYETCMTPITERVYMYLYGQDIEDVNYSLGYTISSYGSTTSRNYYKYDCSGDASYRIEGTVVAASVQYDIAIVKVTGSDVIKMSNAQAATFADDDEVFIGEQVYAIGNPLGGGTSATTGVVSQDSIENYLGVSTATYNVYRQIKTDTAVNGGNSGGGLYNSSGELVGIVNSKLEDESVDNTSYALSGSYVKRLYKLLMESSASSTSTISSTGLSRYYLYYKETTQSDSYGYSYQNIDTGFTTVYSTAYLDASGYARINEIVEASTGSISGLSSGDVINHLTITDASGNIIEDMDVTRKFLLDDALISYRSGYTMKLYINGNQEADGSWADGKEVTVTPKLQQQN